MPPRLDSVCLGADVYASHDTDGWIYLYDEMTEKEICLAPDVFDALLAYVASLRDRQLREHMAEQDAVPAADLKCPKCEGVGLAPHTCPYGVDVGNDNETLCICCDACAFECAMDI